jgi:hypothetical protein
MSTLIYNSVNYAYNRTDSKHVTSSDTMESIKIRTTPKPIDLGTAIAYKPASTVNSNTALAATLPDPLMKKNELNTRKNSPSHYPSPIVSDIIAPSTKTLVIKQYQTPDLVPDTPSATEKKTTAKHKTTTTMPRPTTNPKEPKTSKASKPAPVPKGTAKNPALKKPAAKVPEKRKTAAKARGNKAAEPPKPLSEDERMLARFSLLLSIFLDAANALQDEFGGIPDEMEIISDRFNKNIGKW